MKAHYSCLSLSCGWGVFGSCRRYEGTHCPECGGAIVLTRLEGYRRQDGRELAPPPSIFERLRAAVDDKHEFHVIYYNRCEGASSAARQIAKAGKNIAILSSEVHQRECKNEKIPFFGLHSRIPDGMRNMVIIADVVPDDVLGKWRSVHGAGNKIVAIKSIPQEVH